MVSLMKQPGYYSCDESEFPLDHKPGKGICRRDLKDLSLTTSGDNVQLTVLACASASGFVLPPLIIFETRGEVPGTLYGLSKNGWIDSDIFESCFQQHFLKHTPPTRPHLLLMATHHIINHR